MNIYRPTTTADPPIPPKGGSTADRESGTDMYSDIRYEDIRELAKIASENNVEITLNVDKEGMSVDIKQSRPMSIITTTTESEEEQMASEMRDYCERYEPTYNSEDGSM